MPAQCITLSIDSEESFLTTRHDLDQSTALLDQASISGGSIESSSYLSGQGDNSQFMQMGNDEQTVLGTISTSGLVESASITCASSKSLSLSQNANTLGQSEIETSGKDSSNSASQKAGVLSGGLASAQSISLEDSSITSRQVSSIVGALAYTDAAASSPAETVKATGGLNGIGIVQGQLTSDGASILGNIHANSLESNAYTAVKTTSDYSYASSGDQLSSTIDTTTVIIQQSTGDIKTDDSIANKAIPIPGAWVWSNLGGYAASNPSVIQNNQGENFCFVKGGDNSLYAYTGNDWYGLGGYITSNLCAVKDDQGQIHVFARGGDGSLWDNVFNLDSLMYTWYGLGGYINSDPSAALAPFTNGNLKIAVRGGDNSLWVRDFSPCDLSGGWYPLGGYITSNPQIIFDSQRNLEIFAKDSNNALWCLKGTADDNGMYYGIWHPLGGSITSDAKPIIDPRYPNCIDTVARGSDGNIWGNILDTTTGINNWYGINIPISEPGTIYQGNPDPIVDGDGDIHIFYRGNDGALWDAVGVYKPSENRYNFNGQSLGGFITSDPSALWDKITKQIKIAARGGDGSLWASVIG